MSPIEMNKTSVDIADGAPRSYPRIKLNQRIALPASLYLAEEEGHVPSGM
jgi:hypothetical protein